MGLFDSIVEQPLILYLFETQMLLQCLTQMLCVEVGVYLGGEDTLVAEQLLYLTDACATLQQMRRKGVTEGVGANLLCYACT